MAWNDSINLCDLAKVHRCSRSSEQALFLTVCIEHAEVCHCSAVAHLGTEFWQESHRCQAQFACFCGCTLPVISEECTWTGMCPACHRPRLSDVQYTSIAEAVRSGISSMDENPAHYCAECQTQLAADEYVRCPECDPA